MVLYMCLCTSSSVPEQLMFFSTTKVHMQCSSRLTRVFRWIYTWHDTWHVPCIEHVNGCEVEELIFTKTCSHMSDATKCKSVKYSEIILHNRCVVWCRISHVHWMYFDSIQFNFRLVKSFIEMHCFFLNVFMPHINTWCGQNVIQYNVWPF